MIEKWFQLSKIKAKKQNRIKKSDVVRNKALNLLYAFFMNKVSEYDTKQLLFELSLGRMDYKELLIREIKKDVRPINGPAPIVYNRRNNLYKLRKQNMDEMRNIDLITYIFSNIKGFLEYQYVRRLTHDDIKNIARFIKYEFHPQGSYIFRQGDKSNKFYGLINGEIQIIETKFSDKLRHLKEFIIRMDERDKISEEDKIFFLNQNYKIKTNQKSNKNNIDKKKHQQMEEDEISIKTKSYFVSKINNNQDEKYIINFDDFSTSSLSGNFNIDINNYDSKKFLRKNKSFNLNRNIIKEKDKEKEKKNNLMSNNDRINANKNIRRYSCNNLDKKELAAKFAYKSMKKHKIEKNKNKEIILSEEEKENIDFLNKNLMHFGRIISECHCFGEQEMCKKKRRTYSVICLKDSHFFSLQKEYFDKYILGKIIRSELLKTNFLLDKLQVIQKEEHFFSLITKIIPMLYQKGEILYTPFDKADFLYIVYRGECALCETVKPYNNKNDFLYEKPQMKVISILNEGGIGGLEGYQKDNNYEKYMAVNSSFTIILKLDIKDFEDNTQRFRRSLEPLYLQQKRMFFSIKRKGILFEIGREINKSEKEKKKLKREIKESYILKDKNKVTFKIKSNYIQNINNNLNENDINKKNINNENKVFNYGNNLNIFKSFNMKNNNKLKNNNNRIFTESKTFSPIKIINKVKKYESDKLNNLLPICGKENNSIHYKDKFQTINNSNLKIKINEDININKNISFSPIKSQNNHKKSYSFYHQKHGRNPISLKIHLTQKQEDIHNLVKMREKENICNNNNKSSLHYNIFNFYKQISADLKNALINRTKESVLSFDKIIKNSEENPLERDANNKRNYKLNIHSIKSKKSLNLGKIKTNSKTFDDSIK